MYVVDCIVRVVESENHVNGVPGERLDVLENPTDLEQVLESVNLLPLVMLEPSENKDDAQAWRKVQKDPIELDILDDEGF
mmetsp:Transcript_57186/g.66861  ORF Transcript_57186/g.66861 Transcript_57186/m.66861 type:complete len:80 (-) Transcript_57186:62-301(-)|eukprot:CAMPEP_0194388306 /NCGR_PEP_ID=MMETSP0174-20130528/97796_1 /TAXON_ID=216777 /ORGANISM="Proboscia alata, Strain PI-D3" /LENGTH=79 /DNA_ID=CAMNT_0039179449 /DNA_START=698 /DNA_END=937 /DNA_ORIENTATION=+